MTRRGNIHNCHEDSASSHWISGGREEIWSSDYIWESRREIQMKSFNVSIHHLLIAYIIIISVFFPSWLLRSVILSFSGIWTQSDESKSGICWNGLLHGDFSTTLIMRLLRRNLDLLFKSTPICLGTPVCTLSWRFRACLVRWSLRILFSRIMNSPNAVPWWFPKCSIPIPFKKLEFWVFRMLVSRILAFEQRNSRCSQDNIHHQCQKFPTLAILVKIPPNK